ncbi:hypothetical protein PR048_000083 [Dryococelus australis]|uniref:Uncharacterized protein n=1 Tax=Dryococelus australis TaxID=614101 RepID=A0ABQ9IDN4_9NEOP|nr:hypothetical protein PR048_000083 [Dryococelus australis]
MSTANEQTSEARGYTGLWSLANRSLNSRIFPIPTYDTFNGDSIILLQLNLEKSSENDPRCAGTTLANQRLVSHLPADCLANRELSAARSSLSDMKSVPEPCAASQRIGATIAERLACSPPTKAIRVQSPAGSLRIFAFRNRAEGCRWSAGFLGDLPLPPPFHSGAAQYSPVTLIGSQDLDIKNTPEQTTAAHWRAARRLLHESTHSHAVDPQSNTFETNVLKMSLPIPAQTRTGTFAVVCPMTLVKAVRAKLTHRGVKIKRQLPETNFSQTWNSGSVWMLRLSPDRACFPRQRQRGAGAIRATLPRTSRHERDSGEDRVNRLAGILLPPASNRWPVDDEQHADIGHHRVCPILDNRLPHTASGTMVNVATSRLVINSSDCGDYLITDSPSNNRIMRYCEIVFNKTPSLRGLCCCESGAIRATITRTCSVSSLLRASRAVFPSRRCTELIRQERLSGDVNMKRWGGEVGHRVSTIDVRTETLHSLRVGAMRRYLVRVSVARIAPSLLDLAPTHGSILGEVAPISSHVGILPDDAAGRRVFSGISRFPHHCILVRLQTHLASPSTDLEISELKIIIIIIIFFVRLSNHRERPLAIPPPPPPAGNWGQLCLNIATIEAAARQCPTSFHIRPAAREYLNMASDVFCGRLSFHSPNEDSRAVCERVMCSAVVCRFTRLMRILVQFVSE